MAQVSTNRLRKDIEEKIAKLLVKAITQSRTKKESQALIQALLTPTEQIMLAKRVSIAYLLCKEIDQRTISRILNVSTTTVNTVAALLKLEMGEGLKQAIYKIFNDDELKQIFDDIVGGFYYGPIPPPGVDWGNWRKEKERRKWRRLEPF